MQIASSGSSSLRGLRVHSPEQCLGVRDRRWSREDRECRELARQVPEDASPDRARQHAEQAAQRRVGDPVNRLRVVGIAVEDTAQRGRVQSQGDAEQRHPGGQGLLELDSELPAARCGGLEQGVRVGRSQNVRAGRREQRGRAAVQDGLRGADGNDDVGLGERSIDAESPPAGPAHLDEVRALRVVHLDAAMEPSRELRVNEELQLAVPRLPGKASRDEQRLVAERGAGAVELDHRCGDRGAARVVGRPRNRERGRLDDDRRPAAAGDERLERLSGEREAERVANGSRDVGDRLDRGRRSEHDGVLAGVHHGEPRAVRQGQAGHASYGIER